MVAETAMINSKHACVDDLLANSSSTTSNAGTNSDTYRQNVKIDTTTIETIVTTKAAVVDEWIKEICGLYNGPTLVGLDTEWIMCPKDDKKVAHNKLAILQLCVKDKCLIFQICWKDCVPSSLRDFLMNPNFTFVGVSIAGDLKKLRDECDLHCAKVEELVTVAKRKWPEKWRQIPGLKTLAWEVAGIEMEKNKSITMSNWGERNLMEKQIEYACLDAYASYKIGVELQSDFQGSTP